MCSAGCTSSLRVQFSINYLRSIIQIRCRSYYYYLTFRRFDEKEREQRKGLPQNSRRKGGRFATCKIASFFPNVARPGTQFRIKDSYFPCLCFVFALLRNRDMLPNSALGNQAS